MAFYTKIKIVFAVVLALIISISVYNYLKSLRDEVSIVVADQDIDERSFVKPEMLKEISIRKRDKSTLAPDAISSIKEIEMAISKAKIPKGKVISSKDDIIMGTKQSLQDNKVITENGEINEAYFIANSKRVITVRLDSQGAVSNKLNTGDYVDVIFTSANDTSGSFSTTILQHIQVQDVEKLKDKGGDVSQNISLVVTPQQAVDLAFAKRNGKIDLVLNPVKGDNELVYPTSIKKFTDPYKDVKR